MDRDYIGYLTGKDRTGIAWVTVRVRFVASIVIPVLQENLWFRHLALCSAANITL